MGRLAGLAALVVIASACAVGASQGSLAARSPSPSPAQATANPSPAESSPSPSPLAPGSPIVEVTCSVGGGATAMVLMGSRYSQQLLYDVSDPVHPRRLCIISNTSAHLFTADSFEYVKPLSTAESDVMIHSLGSGNESVAVKLPFDPAFGAWLPDLSVVAYTTQVAPDNDYFFTGGAQVWLYAQGRTAPLFTYRYGIGEGISRFGLTRPVLAISPDGQYVAAGWAGGKGSEPLSVYRVADRSLAATMDQQVSSAFWDRSGHRLFLNRFGYLPEQAWTPEGGVVTLAGAGDWAYLPSVSPDGRLVAYTAYTDPANPLSLRPYVYDLRSGSSRMLIDKPRSQVLFSRDGWVWYAEEGGCTSDAACQGGTMPTGKVFAMQLSGGSEIELSFAAGESPLIQRQGFLDWTSFASGDFWPGT